MPRIEKAAMQIIVRINLIYSDAKYSNFFSLRRISAMLPPYP